jgi:hypothetical protein
MPLVTEVKGYAENFTRASFFVGFAEWASLEARHQQAEQKHQAASLEFPLFAPDR